MLRRFKLAIFALLVASASLAAVGASDSGAAAADPIGGWVLHSNGAVTKSSKLVIALLKEEVKSASSNSALLSTNRFCPGLVGAQPTAEQFDCRPWAGGQTAEQ